MYVRAGWTRALVLGLNAWGQGLCVVEERGHAMLPALMGEQAWMTSNLLARDSWYLQ